MWVALGGALAKKRMRRIKAKPPAFNFDLAEMKKRVESAKSNSVRVPESVVTEDDFLKWLDEQ